MGDIAACIHLADMSASYALEVTPCSRKRYSGSRESKVQVSIEAGRVQNVLRAIPAHI